MGPFYAPDSASCSEAKRVSFRWTWPCPSSTNRWCSSGYRSRKERLANHRAGSADQDERDCQHAGRSKKQTAADGRDGRPHDADDDAGPPDWRLRERPAPGKPIHATPWSRPCGSQPRRSTRERSISSPVGRLRFAVHRRWFLGAAGDEVCLFDVTVDSEATVVRRGNGLGTRMLLRRGRAVPRLFGWRSRSPVRHSRAMQLRVGSAAPGDGRRRL